MAIINSIAEQKLFFACCLPPTFEYIANMRQLLLIIFSFVLLFICVGCGEKLTPEERVVRLRRLVDEEKFDEARRHVGILLRERPTDRVVLYLSGKVYYAQKVLDSALTVAKQYTDLFPDDIEGFKFQYQVAEELNDYESQIWAVSQLRYLENNNRKYLPRIAELNLLMNKPGMAEEVCKDILEYDPGNTQVMFTLAAALAGMDKLDSAIIVMEELNRRHPNKMEILFNLGNYLASTERYEEARKVFIQTTSLWPEQNGGWYGLGNVLIQMGDTSGARQAYQRVYESDSTFLGVDSILQNLSHPPAPVPPDSR